MAQDPRLDSLMQYALSEVTDGPTDDTAALRQRVTDLERLIRVILRTPNVQVGAGAPTGAARDGTLYVDTTNSRLYARSAGAWKFAAIA